MLLSAFETWPIYRPTPGKKSQCVNFRCLRSILGVSWRDRIPNAATIFERTGAPFIFSLLRMYRLFQSGHLCRMEDGRLPKESLMGKQPSAPRPVSPQTPLRGRFNPLMPSVWLFIRKSGLLKIHIKGKLKTFHYYLWLVCYYLEAVCDP